MEYRTELRKRTPNPLFHPLMLSEHLLDFIRSLDLLKNPIYWLMPFVPWTLYLQYGGGQTTASITFGSAALALIPMAALMTASTEQIANRAGETLGGFLNATFGNAPELIISLMALKAGLLDMVKASIVGVIMTNLLFVLGLSLLIGGLYNQEQKFNRRGVRVERSLLMIAAISVIVPSVFDNFISPDTYRHEMALNKAVAVVLLVTYGFNLLFTLKTHPHYFTPKNPEEAVEQDAAQWPLLPAVGMLMLASVVLALLSETLVGSIEETARQLDMSKAFIGVIIIALIGGAPESVAAVTMAKKNKLDLTLGITAGSSIQIALFVAPVLVLSSYYLAPKPINLVVGNAGIMIVLLPVLIFAMVAADGKSNWFKGIQLLSVYLLMALFCYFLPDRPELPLIKP
ncbi:calcium/proton exchanger [Methylomonas sp. MgM2]